MSCFQSESGSAFKVELDFSLVYYSTQKTLPQFKYFSWVRLLRKLLEGKLVIWCTKKILGVLTEIPSFNLFQCNMKLKQRSGTSLIFGVLGIIKQ